MRPRRRVSSSGRGFGFRSKVVREGMAPRSSGISPDASVISITIAHNYRRTIAERQTYKAPVEMITLKQLCNELKVDPREAREKLRLAARDAKKNPELAKSHQPGHSWEWPNSAALKEARMALIGGC